MQLCLLIILAASGVFRGESQATFDFYIRPTRSLATPATGAVKRVTSWSDIECSAQCSSAGAQCNSALYLSSDGICLMSDQQLATFPDVAEGSRPFVKGFATPLPEPASPPTASSTTAQTTTSTSLPSQASSVTLEGIEFRVIQQRVDGSVNFSRSWREYEAGFGDANNFWIGLTDIHNYTKSGTVLRVENTRWNGQMYVAEYLGFRVDSAASNYSITSAVFATNSSNASDCLTGGIPVQFSTMDADNDGVQNRFVARDYASAAGWWFYRKDNLCGNPNGMFTLSESISCNSHFPIPMSWSIANNDCSRATMRATCMMVMV